MWKEHLVARLSPVASQVLLLLLARRETLAGRETNAHQEEFAAHHTGLSRRSILHALHGLEKAGLVVIIHQAGSSPQVLFIQPAEEFFHVDTTVDTELVFDWRSQVERLPSEAEPAEGVEGVGSQKPGPQANPDPDPIAVCRTADSKHDRPMQVAALQALWGVAFPEGEYPFQRLQDATAKEFLVGRSAEEVGGAILEAVGSSKGRINYPRAFIKKVLSNLHNKQQKGEKPEEKPVINDDLRMLARLGKEQFSAGKAQEAAELGGYEPGVTLRA